MKDKRKLLQTAKGLSIACKFGIKPIQAWYDFVESLDYDELVYLTAKDKEAHLNGKW